VSSGHRHTPGRALLCSAVILAGGLGAAQEALADRGGEQSKNLMTVQGQQAPPAWTVAVDGGMAVPFPSNGRTRRGTVGLSISRLFWHHLDLELAVRVGVSEISTDLVASSRVGLGLALGALGLSIGCRLGYASMHIDKGDLGSLWTDALLVNPGVELALRVMRHLEIRAAALSVSLYWNQVWMVAWEPSVGLGVRF
jgi:hypothetical protein